MANTAYSVLYGAVTTKLSMSDTASTAKSKICINDAIREIRGEGEWPFINGIDSFMIGTGGKQYSPADTYYEQPMRVRISDQKTIGTTDTIITVSVPVAGTGRYTYTSGTDPNLGAEHQEVGDIMTTTGFLNAGNNVTNAVITAVGTDYIDITSTPVVEAKTGPVVKMICKCDGTKVTRADRDKTIVTNTNISKYAYSIPTEGKIEFNAVISSTSGIFYDYKKTYIALSADSDKSEIPPSYDHVVVYLAMALLLELEDDSRSDNNYAKYRFELGKMKRTYFYNDDVETTMVRGGSLQI